MCQNVSYMNGFSFSLISHFIFGPQLTIDNCNCREWHCKGDYCLSDKTFWLAEIKNHNLLLQEFFPSGDINKHIPPFYRALMTNQCMIPSKSNLGKPMSSLGLLTEHEKSRWHQSLLGTRKSHPSMEGGLPLSVTLAPSMYVQLGQN